jgi:hypothetical protein
MFFMEYFRIAVDHLDYTTTCQNYIVSVNFTVGTKNLVNYRFYALFIILEVPIKLTNSKNDNGLKSVL